MEEKKKSKTGIAVCIVVIIGVLIIAVVGYGCYMWGKSQMPKPQPKENYQCPEENIPEGGFYNQTDNYAYLSSDGEGIEMVGFINNKEIYIGKNNDEGNFINFVKVDNIKNGLKIRIFNEIGNTGWAPAFYIICEDGKVYSIYPINQDLNRLETNEIFNEYKIKDIISLTYTGCTEDDEENCGTSAKVILQDGTEKIIK